jgi:hypothetical protein
VFRYGGLCCKDLTVHCSSHMLLARACCNAPSADASCRGLCTRLLFCGLARADWQQKTTDWDGTGQRGIMVRYVLHDQVRRVLILGLSSATQVGYPVPAVRPILFLLSPFPVVSSYRIVSIQYMKSHLLHVVLSLMYIRTHVQDGRRRPCDTCITSYRAHLNT